MRSCAIAMAVGVFPLPPTVKLPTHRTGTAACRPGWAIRRAATKPQAAPAGAGSRAAAPPPRHQNPGSRIAGAVLDPQLHEIGFERADGAFQRAAEPVDAELGGDRGAVACRAVLDPGGDPNRQRSGVGDEI